MWLTADAEHNLKTVNVATELKQVKIFLNNLILGNLEL